MPTFTNVAAAVVMVIAWVLLSWAAFLRTRLENHHVSMPTRPFSGGRRFALWLDPSNYTEVGRTYRQRCIRAEAIVVAWVIIAPAA